jgi:ribosomal protein L2, bacterial/organellar
MKSYKPTTPSRRFMTTQDFSDLTKGKRPEKKLTKMVGRKGGRNSDGRITSRFRGGGAKRQLRLVDFKGYDKAGIPARVAAVEYDPYRSARIVLINYADGEKRYHLGRKGVKVGDEILAGSDAPIRPGNRKKLRDIPEGVDVFNLEVTPDTKGKLIRSAGQFATLIGRDEAQEIVFLKLPSGQMRKFNEKCRATIGQVGNEQHKNVVIGKAGRSRRLGRKPKVLGLNMNPVDHPMGGGEAHADIGLKKGIKSFAGKRVAPGMKTRKKKKWSNKFIVKSSGRK